MCFKASEPHPHPPVIFADAGIEQMVSGAMALVQVTSEDPFAGLPEQQEFGMLPGDLDLYYDDV